MEEATNHSPFIPLNQLKKTKLFFSLIGFMNLWMKSMDEKIL